MVFNIIGKFDPEKITDNNYFSNNVAHRGLNSWYSQDHILNLNFLENLCSEYVYECTIRKISIFFAGYLDNYKELTIIASRLGIELKSKSSAELIFSFYNSHKGELNFLKTFYGSFCFGIWDYKRRKFMLGTDKLSKQPVFYYKNKNSIFFSNSILLLVKNIKHDLSINRTSLISYYQQRYINAPNTIFNNIHKLKANSCIVIDLKDTMEFITLNETERSYSNNKNSFTLNIREALLSSIRSVIPLDKKIGVMLSSGLDSSIILAVTKNVTKSVYPLIISYEGIEECDESRLAKNLANFIGTEYIEINISNKNIKNYIEDSVKCLEQPIYSTISPATYAMTFAANEYNINTILTGDGADELLMGDHFIWDIYQAISKGSDWKSIYCSYLNWLPKNYNTLFTDKFESYNLSNRFIKNPMEWIRHFELYEYLPNYTLARLNNIIGSFNIKFETPFLHQNILEWATKCRAEDFVSTSLSKSILREQFQGLLPENVLSRPKSPFTSPYVKWMKNPLKEDIQDIILSTDYHQKLGLNHSILKLLLEDCYKGTGRNFPLLWGIYILYKWYDNFKSKRLL